MTLTTAAAAALAAGEHLVHRPRGVVHLYRGPLTTSGRYAQAGPECGTRTNRLSVLDRTAGDERRMCRRCERLLPQPKVLVTREDWQKYAAAFTAADLADEVRAAETVADVDRVVHLALVGPGRRAATEPLDHAGSGRSLMDRIAARRREVDVIRAEREIAAWERSRDIQNRSKIARARDTAAEAQRRAERSGNPVDRLLADKARTRADQMTRRHPTAV